MNVSVLTIEMCELLINNGTLNIPDNVMKALIKSYIYVLVVLEWCVYSRISLIIYVFIIYL
jgi:hypothetical protein